MSCPGTTVTPRLLCDWQRFMSLFMWNPPRVLLCFFYPSRRPQAQTAVSLQEAQYPYYFSGGKKCDLTPILKLFFPDTWSDVWNRIKMVSESKVSSQRVIVWVAHDKLWDHLCDKPGPSPFCLVSESRRACTHQQARSQFVFLPVDLMHLSTGAARRKSEIKSRLILLLVYVCCPKSSGMPDCCTCFEYLHLLD